MDPLAEAERYGVDLNEGLTDGTISSDPLQVLAPNTDLEDAAIDHSTWMLEEDTFSHTGEDGSDPGDRIVEAGYALTGSWSWRENLAWTGTSGTLSLAAAIAEHHEGLYLSEGHRVNTFAAESSEIGVAQVSGQFTYASETYNASLLTINFASSGSDHFVTGVAYTDSDGDDFYSIGEGIGGITISADGDSDATANAGGYGVAVGVDAATAVTVSSGADELATLTIDTSAGNAKLDVVTDSDGNQVLYVSTDTTLLTGITNATLLGAGDLTLTGNDADNVLIGNGGANVLIGGGGDDTLSGGEGSDVVRGGSGDDILLGGAGRDLSWDSLDGSTITADNTDELLGGAGNDQLNGQSGSDLLSGGTGDDMLTGGGGRDAFVFVAGNDVILDFTNNVDTILFDGSALGVSTVNEVLNIAEIVDGNAIITFDAGSLQIDDVDNLAILSNDLLVF